MKNLNTFRNNIHPKRIVPIESMKNVQGGLRYTTRSWWQFLLKAKALILSGENIQVGYDHSQREFCIDW